MAKEESKAKIVLERTYNVPLRKEFLKVPKYKRSKKAVTALTQFLAKHMKTDIKNVRIGNYLNNSIWAHGIKNPPHHVKVLVTKDDKGMVYAELPGKLAEAKEEKSGKKPAKLDAKKADKTPAKEDISEEPLESDEEAAKETASEEPKKPKVVKKKPAPKAE
jgi:large subunit ribosomal protein L31e